MIEYIVRDRNQLFPVMPLADGIFYLAKMLHEIRLAIVLGDLQNVTKLFDLQPIRMQIVPVQTRRVGEL